MLCKRGSAAIAEIFTDALLAAHEIEWTGQKLSTPSDLIAIFSSSPEQFDKAFIVNAEHEIEHGKEIKKTTKKESRRGDWLKSLFFQEHCLLRPAIKNGTYENLLNRSRINFRKTT